MKKIVRGNDFTLRIPVKKIVNGEQVSFPLTDCTDIAVHVVSKYKRTALPYTIDKESNDVLLADVDGTALSLGTYALEVTGKLEGANWRSYEYEQFAIVDNNASSDTVFEGGTTEGDTNIEGSNGGNADKGCMDVKIEGFAVDTALVVLPPISARATIIELIANADAAIAAVRETEAAVKASEDVRVENESLRQRAEEQRAESEATRQTAEEQRAESETERVANEKTRKINEEARVAAEEQRAATFTELSEAVSTAVGKADEAIKAANAAIDKANVAESERAEAERQRAEAEATRNREEGIRQESETERVRQETARETAEVARQNAEVEREKADAEREKRVSEAISDTSSAAKTAADAAAVAMETAKQGMVATTEAERVNAELRGNVLTVTDRTGEVKTLELMDQAEAATIKTELAGKFDKASVVQELGEAEDKVVSQKTVSTKLSDLTKKTSNVESSSTSDTDEEIIIGESEENYVVKIGVYGIKAKDYLDKDGNKVFDNYLYHPNRDTYAEQMSNLKCHTQKNVGMYFFPSSFTFPSENGKCYLDSSRSKFGKSVRLEIQNYTQDKTSTEGKDRASLSFLFDKEIESKETISIWVKCEHKYLSEPFRYDSKEESLTLDANGKKQQSLHGIKFQFYNNGLLQKQVIIPISEFQSKVTTYGESNSTWAGWGYKAPNTKCDIVGWKLLKLPENLALTFDRVDITLNTFEYYPNMEINFGHVVIDQKIIPTLIITKDGNFYDEKSLEFTKWCYTNNIPRNGGGALLDESTLTEAQKEANQIIKKMYLDGMIELSQYNKDQKMYDYINSIKYLKGDIGNWTGAEPYYQSKVVTNRPCISLNASLTYIDDVIMNSAKQVGYKVLRGSGYFNYGGTSYLDEEECVIYCGNLCNETNSSIDNEEKYNTALQYRIKDGKKAVDDIISLGECRCMLSHAELSKEDAITDSSGAIREAIEAILTYAKEKESQGLLQIVTMDKFYNQCVK